MPGRSRAECGGHSRSQPSTAQHDSLFSLLQGSRILESLVSGPEGEEPVEYKSLQWFGATVRAHGSSILVRPGGLGGVVTRGRAVGDYSGAQA